MLGRVLAKIGLVLTAANFVYQACEPPHHWGAALERSWFQVVALFIVWLNLRDRVTFRPPAPRPRRPGKVPPPAA